MGPALFLLFTNDLASHITHGKLVSYADDVQFLDSDAPNDLSSLETRIESTLATALNWFAKNSLKINPTKTELLLFKTRNRKTREIAVHFDDHTLVTATKAKVLGLVLDPALTWEHHITLTVQRCNRILIGLCKLRSKIPRELRVFLVETLVFPLIRYCACVWGGACATQRTRLQKVINFAARIVSNLKRRDHVSAALSELGWQSVDDIITACDIALIDRLLAREEAPEAIKNMLVFRSHVSARETRSSAAGSLQLPQVQERSRKVRGQEVKKGQNRAIL